MSERDVNFGRVNDTLACRRRSVDLLSKSGAMPRLTSFRYLLHSNQDARSCRSQSDRPDKRRSLETAFPPLTPIHT